MVVFLASCPASSSSVLYTSRHQLLIFLPTYWLVHLVCPYIPVHQAICLAVQAYCRSADGVAEVSH